jgi:hypothetical protein
VGKLSWTLLQDSNSEEIHIEVELEDVFRRCVTGSPLLLFFRPTVSTRANEALLSAKDLRDRMLILPWPLSKVTHGFLCEEILVNYLSFMIQGKYSFLCVSLILPKINTLIHRLIPDVSEISNQELTILPIGHLNYIRIPDEDVMKQI